MKSKDFFFFGKHFLFMKKKKKETVTRHPLAETHGSLTLTVKPPVFYFISQWPRSRRKVKVKKIKNQKVNNKDLSKTWKTPQVLPYNNSLVKTLICTITKKGTAAQAFHLDRLLCTLNILQALFISWVIYIGSSVLGKCVSCQNQLFKSILELIKKSVHCSTYLHHAQNWKICIITFRPQT